MAFITVDRYDDLIPSLLEGRGDIIAANFSATPQRRERVKFSVPVDVVSEQIITRKTDTTLRAFTDLTGRTITVRRSSSFWQTVQDLQSKYPDLQVREAPEHFDTEQISGWCSSEHR